MLDAEIALRHSRAIVQPKSFMTNLTRNRLWFIAVFALSCYPCFSQPSGQFSLDFDNSTPLIVMNGDFNVADEIIGADDQTIPLNFSVAISHRSNGALHGVGAAIAQIGDDFVPAIYHASGRVSGGGDNLQVFLVVTLQGEGPVAGRDTKFKIDVAYRLFFRWDERVPSGRWRRLLEHRYERPALQKTVRQRAGPAFGRSNIKWSVEWPIL